MFFEKKGQYFNVSLIIIMFLTGARFSFASDQPVAFGLILDTNATNPNDYKIERNPEFAKQIVNFTLLYQGDKVTILKEGVEVKILLGGTEEKVITKKEPPYEVPEMEIPTLWGNFVMQVSSLFLGENGSNNSPEAAASRGGPSGTSSKQEETPLNMNLLPTTGSDPYYLLPGKRPLYLGWSGGQPPYAIKITKKGQCEEVIDFLVSSEPRVKTEVIDFKVGTDLYKVTIRDSNKKDVMGQFSVVGENKNPSLPQSEEIKNEEIQQMSQALWLLKQKDGSKWLFEVYQWISAIAEGKNKGIAEELRTKLERK